MRTTLSRRASPTASSGLNGIGHGRERVAALDRDLPGALVLLRLEGVVDLRRVEHRRIEDRMAAERCRCPAGCSWSLVASIISACVRLLRLQPPHRAARDHDVVAVAILQMAEVAEQIARALVDEQQLVAVAIARELGHRLVELPDRASAGADCSAPARPARARAAPSPACSGRTRAAAAGRRNRLQPVGGCL